MVSWFHPGPGSVPEPCSQSPGSGPGRVVDMLRRSEVAAAPWTLQTVSLVTVSSETV